MDQSLKTLWVDRVELKLRGDESLVMLVCQTLAPDGEHMLEAARLQVTKRHAKRIAEVLMRLVTEDESKESAPA